MAFCRYTPIVRLEFNGNLLSQIDHSFERLSSFAMQVLDDKIGKLRLGIGKIGSIPVKYHGQRKRVPVFIDKDIIIIRHECLCSNIKLSVNGLYRKVPNWGAASGTAIQSEVNPWVELGQRQRRTLIAKFGEWLSQMIRRVRIGTEDAVFDIVETQNDATNVVRQTSEETSTSKACAGHPNFDVGMLGHQIVQIDHKGTSHLLVHARQT
mmetsp:Transcript_12948/g.27966  ORF Transcript_12948/g.27966 Transcript_12948/m.27966 type:complete len:209 (-) Transcript_12948:57-683(-)